MAAMSAWLTSVDRQIWALSFGLDGWNRLGRVGSLALATNALAWPWVATQAHWSSAMTAMRGAIAYAAGTGAKRAAR
jgi:hypothetical protein